MSRYAGHLYMLLASVFWGLMSPVGKDVMNGGVTALDLVTFRMAGSALCFWIASCFMKAERVERGDLLRLFGAGLFAVVFNQGAYIVGLSLTSPINASIITTTAPIATLVLSVLFLHEALTGRKLCGIALSAAGAVILIVEGGGGPGGGHLAGDLLCLMAQASFASYLIFFRDTVAKYSPATCMKWMFTFSAAAFLPFSWGEVSTLGFGSLSLLAWAEIAFVVVGATVMTFFFLMKAQKLLRPLAVSMYDYVQPVVATAAAMALGVGMLDGTKAAAALLIFAGVYVVVSSREGR